MGVVSQKLRDSARGQDCTLRMACCNRDPATTVLAHLPSIIHGMGTKSDDWHAVFACSSCHDALDRRMEKFLHHYCIDALQRTQRIWFEMGLMKVPITEKRVKKSDKIMPRGVLYEASTNQEIRDAE